MDSDAKRKLVERLQVEAREAPGRYRFKVALLALAGYAVLVALLLVALGVPLALLAAMAVRGRMEPGLAIPILILGSVGVVMLRAMWLRFGAPDGYRLQPGETPELEAEIERLRAAVGAPPLDGIVIDGDLNAMAAQAPRLLGLGGHRQYLVLGLPVMRLLDREELASVIAHEFGHFGERDGHFTGWIYRVRLSWYRVLNGLAESGSTIAHLLYGFFKWYVPYFDAYSFALARDKEYQADAAAARAVGAATAGSALLRIELAEQRLRRGFWPQLLARAAVQKHPPLQLHGELAQALRQTLRFDPARLQSTTKPEADLDDTHPSLPQRLAALGVQAGLREHAGGSAAEAWLGPALARIEGELDKHWRKENEARWLAEYQAAAKDRSRLAEMDGQAPQTAAETLEYLRLIRKLRPGFDAEQLYAQAIERFPDSALAHYEAGSLRLQSGDWESGVGSLRCAMQLDAGAIGPAFAQLDEWLGDPSIDADAAAKLQALRDEFSAQARSLDVRDGVETADEFIPHNLDAAVLQQLQITLGRHERVGRAWLVRKRIDMADETAHYVILVDWRGSVASEAAGLKALSDAFRLPGSHSVFTGTDRRDMAKRVQRIGGDPVYRRGR
ncbi:MAG TPA: M48 family metalloprotease [Luteimonas sp.]|nr:M48 family metalloprotease [Luteimonas sp.]